MPFGIDCYCYKNDIYIENGCNYFGRDNVYIQNKDFRELININNCSKDDFFYFDPPYINTTAVYNENKGWADVDDKELYSVLNNLSDKGYRWALSSAMENKGVKNVNLSNWVEVNNLKYYVHYFNNFAYTACGKGNAQTIEVVVTNYDFTKYMSNNNLNRKKLF